MAVRGRRTGARRRSRQDQQPAETHGEPAGQELLDGTLVLAAQAAPDLVAQHAAVLGDEVPGGHISPAQRIRFVQHLQRAYGNGHVARVVAALQRAPAAPCTEPPAKPLPKAPEDDPRFTAVAGKIHQIAAREKKHPPPKSKAAEAQAAAEPPQNERLSKAAAAQVETLSRQKPGTFDKKAFMTAVRQAIEAATPRSLEEADNFKETGKVALVKAQVGGLITKGKESSEKDIKQKTDEPPDPSKVESKPVTPLKPEQPGPAPGNAGARQVMPSPKPTAETSLAYGPCELRSTMAEAGVTEEQLKKSNEPEFTAALEAKKEAEKHAAEAPKQYRAEEQAILAQARDDAGTTASQQLGAMHGSRTGILARVAGNKAGAKSKDEAAREQVAARIEAIYTKTKEDVNQILEGLDGKVDAAFETGEKAARTFFENYVDAQMRAYKERRYSGVRGKLRWLKDKVLGMPDEVNAFYQQGRRLYLERMDAVISQIADIVGTELSRAKARIAAGREQVAAYVASLPRELKKVGLEAQERIGEQFDQLEQSVDAKQDELVNGLAQKYVAARDALDQRITEMQEENKGLVDRAKDAIKGVVETILKLKDMLLGVLKKAAGVINQIIKDPIGFLSKLVGAIKQGLNQFVANIGKHLQAGLLAWLFGALAEAGIQLPERLDLKGILSLVLQLLGLTYENVRARAVRLVGEKVVARIEQVAEVFKVLIAEGPAGLWRFLQDRLADLKETVLEQIKDFVITKVITAGITWLIGLLNPASAFIKACKAIYDIIMFFIERGSQIMELVSSILDSIGAIASGAIGAAAALVERSLAKALPVAISFLASLLGLGGIGEKIRKIIETIQKPVNTAIDRLIGGVLKGARKLFGGAAEKVKAGVSWARAKAKQGAEWMQGKARAAGEWARAKVRGPAERGEGAPPVHGDVKARARADLAAAIPGEISSVDEVRPIVSAVFHKYKSEGLKSLDVAEVPSRPGLFEIIAVASPADGIVKFRVRDLELRYPRTALVAEMNGESLGRWENREGKHAEVRLLSDLYERWEHLAAQGLVKKGRPNTLVIQITRSPCSKCAGQLSRLVTTMVSRGYPVQLDIRMASLYGGLGAEKSILALQRLSKRGAVLSTIAVQQMVQEELLDGDELSDDIRADIDRRVTQLQQLLATIDAVKAS
jgi:hypothetical protein